MPLCFVCSKKTTLACHECDPADNPVFCCSEECAEDPNFMFHWNSHIEVKRKSDILGTDDESEAKRRQQLAEADTDYSSEEESNESVSSEELDPGVPYPDENESSSEESDLDLSLTKRPERKSTVTPTQPRQMPTPIVYTMTEVIKLEDGQFLVHVEVFRSQKNAKAYVQKLMQNPVYGITSSWAPVQGYQLRWKGMTAQRGTPKPREITLTIENTALK